MLEIKFVRKNLSEVQKALDARGQTADLDTFKKCDQDRRAILLKIEALRHQRNLVSDQIAEMKKAGENADEQVTDMREVSSRIKSLDPERTKHENEIETILMGIPNIPHKSVPVGNNESKNETVKKIGIPPVFDFSPLAHWEIGKTWGSWTLTVPLGLPGPVFLCTSEPAPDLKGL